MTKIQAPPSETSKVKGLVWPGKQYISEALASALEAKKFGYEKPARPKVKICVLVPINFWPKNREEH